MEAKGQGVRDELFCTNPSISCGRELLLRLGQCQWANLNRVFHRNPGLLDEVIKILFIIEEWDIGTMNFEMMVIIIYNGDQNHL